MTGNSGRIVGVDAVRGLAIVLMVFSHGLNWFHVDGSHTVFSIGRMSLGDVAAPLFFVIAGVSLSLSFDARRRSGISNNRLLAQYRNRFRQLFVLGIPISFAWGVLQAQAITLGLFVMLVLHVFEREGPVHTDTTASAGRRRWGEVWPAIFALIALIGHALVVGSELRSPVLGLLFHGQFPMLAIMSFVAFGFAWGRRLHDRRWSRSFYAVGAVFAGTSWIVARATGPDGVLEPLARTDMPVPYVLAGVAVSLLLLAVLQSRLLRNAGTVQLLGTIGRHGLFLYLAHYGLILAQVIVFGWWHSLDTGAAVAASLLLVVMTIVIGVGYRVDARSIYSLMDGVGRWWSGNEAIGNSVGGGDGSPGRRTSSVGATHATVPLHTGVPPNRW